jgi:hypothetical protein
MLFCSVLIFLNYVQWLAVWCSKVVTVDVTFFNPQNQTWLRVHYDTPHSVYISPSFLITAEIALINPPFACQPLSNITGKIVLASIGFCSIETKARNVQNGGGVV